MTAKNIWMNLLVMLTILLLAGCQPTVYAVHLMPTPTAISTGAFDPFANTPEEERDSSILLGYATNRMPLGAKEARFYTRNFDQDLRMGVTTVQIGDGNKTWDEIRELSRKGARKDQILLSMVNVREIAVLGAEESLETLSPTMAQMMRNINEYIERSPTKEITVYVHGANNNFTAPPHTQHNIATSLVASPLY